MAPKDLNPFRLDPEVMVSIPSSPDLREETVSPEAVWLDVRYTSPEDVGDALLDDFPKKAPLLALALLGAKILAALLLLVLWLLDLDDFEDCNQDKIFSNE